MRRWLLVTAPLYQSAPDAVTKHQAGDIYSQGLGGRISKIKALADVYSRLLAVSSEGRERESPSMSFLVRALIHPGGPHSQDLTTS